MRIARHVVARKKQHLVALPAQLLAHLGLTPGVMVWWHIGKKRQATLTVSGRVRGGRPAIDEDCPTCAKLRAEIDRYRRELREGEAATAGQYFKAGYMRALGDVGNVKYDVEVALTLLKEVLARLPARGVGREPSSKRARARTETAPGPDHYPPPHSPRAPDVVGQGAATSGRSAPGGPLEH